MYFVCFRFFESGVPIISSYLSIVFVCLTWCKSFWILFLIIKSSFKNHNAHIGCILRRPWQKCNIWKRFVILNIIIIKTPATTCHIMLSFLYVSNVKAYILNLIPISETLFLPFLLCIHSKIWSQYLYRLDIFVILEKDNAANGNRYLTLFVIILALVGVRH